MVNGDKFGAIGKRRLDLHGMDHFGDTGHTLTFGYDVRARFHQIGDRAAIARAFHHKIGDQGDGFGVVQFDTARQPCRAPPSPQG